MFEFTDIAMFEDSSKVTDKPMAESSSKNESALITNDASITSTKINEEEPIKRPMLGKIPKSHSVSTGTSPPPQSISTQVREEKRSFYLDYRTLPRIKETRSVRYEMYAFQTYDYLPSRGSGGGFVRAASVSKGLLYYEDSDGEVKRKINT